MNRQYKNKAVNHVNPPIPVSLEADRISFECSSGNAALKSGTNEVASYYSYIQNNAKD